MERVQRIIAEFNDRAMDLYDDEAAAATAASRPRTATACRAFPFVTLGVGALTVTPSLCERIRPEDIASAAAHVATRSSMNLSLVSERYGGGSLAQLAGG